MSEDRAKLFNSLRASTKALLGFADDPLTASQQIRLDRAIAMRLVVDDALAKQMRGEEIDVKAFTAASEDLERLVGGNPHAPPAEGRFGPSARERLRVQLESILLDESREREMAHNPAAARAKFEEELAAAIAKFGMDGEIFPPRPTNKDDASDDVRSASSEASSDVQKALPPPRPLTDAERKANVDRLNAEPANPPRPLRTEPWRGYVPEYEDGGLLGGGSPWRR